MHRATESEAEALRRFLAGSVARGASGTDRIAPRGDVTALMYFFWTREEAPRRWPAFEGALLETWRNCGLLKTVVVSNGPHDCLAAFAARFPNVEVQVEPSLRPGEIDTMSVDCNARLHARFATPYVLVVQNDGFPVRPGLDEFVERGYDFIGSPYCRALPVPDLLTRILNYCPSNGGFSLRTKRICELAARSWTKRYAGRAFVVAEMSEDLFYTRTLPRREPLFWLRRRQAPSIVSEFFSYEGEFPLCAKSLPFGFHTATAFAALQEKFGKVMRNSCHQGEPCIIRQGRD